MAKDNLKKDKEQLLNEAIKDVYNLDQNSGEAEFLDNNKDIENAVNDKDVSLKDFEKFLK